MAALWRDGAVILTGLADTDDNATNFRDLARDLPAKLFESAVPGAPRLLSPDAPVSGVHEELRKAKRLGKYLPGSGLLPHTDGYVYGDHMPDFLFLVCEQPSPAGGANTLIDGQALLAALKNASAESRQLVEWLSETPVDLSEKATSGLTDGRPAQGPVVQWLNTLEGRLRLKWRRQIDVREAQRDASWQPLPQAGAEAIARGGSALGTHVGCLDDSKPPTERPYVSLWHPLGSANASAAAEVRAKLREFDAVLQRIGAIASAGWSFSLARGEALVADNYRMLHARSPYQPGGEDGAAGGSEALAGAAAASEPERRFWRVWSWTSEGSGPPPDGARTSQPLDKNVFPGEGEAQHPGGSASGAGAREADL